MELVLQGLEVRSQRTGSSDVPEQKKDVLAQWEGNGPSLLLFAPFRASVDWMVSTHTDEGGPLDQSSDSNADLILKHPPRHSQK